jgi:hypothetical protein
MPINSIFAGRVRVWKVCGQWTWCPEAEAAPLGAKIANRYLGDPDVIHLMHSERHGEYIRGAVKRSEPA